MQMPKVDKKDLPKLIETIELNVDETKKFEMYNNEDDIKSEETFNKYIEKIVRSSYEYKSFIKALKTEMDLTKCKFIPEVDINDDKRLTMEMHHYPLSLYDIVSSYREKLKTNYEYKKSYESFKIAEDVIKMHFEGNIGIVPLSYTAHELAHNGDLFIPLNEEFVFGNFEGLFNQVELEAPLENKLAAVKKMTKKYEEDPSLYESEVLDKVKTEIKMKSEVKPNKIVQ
ncbi:hypothetical protein CPT_MarsHill_165 [Staphylococcus phage MarsHill]|nr:hypothetical protein CPT_MarsHill_165 [Staphylococcus phage MarsHill]